MDFEDLPRSDKENLIGLFGLSEQETRLLELRYVLDMSYPRIAAEMSMSEKSVGPMLTRARKHMVLIAKNCPPDDDRASRLISVLGWDTLEWPTLGNRHKERRMQ